MELQDKVCFITGGASGLGLATARNFVAAGARVFLYDMNEANARARAGELGDHAQFGAGDVADEAAVRAAVQKCVDAFGTIHVDVNCAGVGSAMRTVGRDGPHRLDVFQRVVQINLIGTFNTLRLCAEVMQNNEPTNEDGERGVIINVASVAAFDGQVGQAAYSASKGGIVGMTLPIARDLSLAAIRVMTIAPGIFETPMMAGAPPQVRDPLVEMTQFPKRLGNAEEFAATAAHIVRCGYLNGEVIRLDAGIRMQPR